MQTAIEQFLAGLVRERGLSPNTVAAYRNDLEQLTAYLQEQEGIREWSALRSDHLSAFLDYLRQRQYADTTTARKLAAIKSFCQYLVRSRTLPENPAHGLPAPRAGRFTPHAISPQEIQQLIQAASADRSPEGLRDRAMLVTLATTGLRVSELTALDLSDVDLNHGQLIVRRPNGRERRVPLVRDAIEALRDYLEYGRPVFGPTKFEQALFLNHRGTRLTRQGFWLILKGYADAVGLPEVTPHTLRHSFAVQALANGWELRDVQRILGHVSPATTLVYRRLVERVLQSDGRVPAGPECYHQEVKMGAAMSPVGDA
ncbi:tyrosine-type recombinase/integrase [Thermomicrobium sp. CFH 73360]|uniref:tyrosine-type recombinase/integrase n=1 Tax=Thermomicrobium sp. CFH 73360 TaxID=2951987 RepID=UPI002076B80E|nr:tyrosine-type recombinase/integrase [Thermomicrobium sp. CFH 73360]MCM8744940.1 tyrosine-type recombinase/integrase [Thermomicrobium sp. CFH 73360]